MRRFGRYHYNAIAKDIREEFSAHIAEYQHSIDEYADAIGETRAERHKMFAANAALTKLALRLAKRFKEDNPEFDPLKFLDACSPNADLYPLSELWED